VLAGCGVSDDRRQVREAVTAFYAEVQRADGGAACQRLAPPAAEALERQASRPCPAAVVDLQLSGGAVAEVEVFETNARVAFRGGEMAFADRRAGGWKVSAAGCKAQPSGPAECEVEG
jgi:hypothetical protein